MSKAKKTRKGARRPSGRPVKKEHWLVRFWRLGLPVVCYTLVLAGYLAVSSFNMCADTIGRLTGRIETQMLSPDDFQLIDLNKLDNGDYQPHQLDPQMILEDLPEQVRTLRFAAEYSANPFEICLYYTTKPDEPFSDTKRVWPVLQEDGSYLFTLPRGRITRLRLDPASQGVTITFQGIVLNEPRPLSSYYAPGWGGAAALLALPMLAAAVLRWALEAFRHYKEKAKARRKLNAAGDGADKKAASGKNEKELPTEKAADEKPPGEKPAKANKNHMKFRKKPPRR